jgi:hypothetical protein
MPDGTYQLKIIDIDLIAMDARADTRFMPNLLAVREKAMYGLNRIDMFGNKKKVFPC